MKAARLHGPHDLRVDELPEPSAPGPGEVLLEVTAVGICGSDLHYWQHGGIGDTRLVHPLVMGHEPAGVVLAVGDLVTGLRRGSRVAIDPAVPCGYCEWCAAGHPNLCPNVAFFGSPPTDGALRERLVHPAQCCFELPDGLTAVDGALCETLGVAIHAVDLSHLHPGQSAAVIGCGTVGLMCLQVARCAGAAPLYAVDLLHHRLQVALSLGADHAIDASEMDATQAIEALSGGRGVDVAFDCATSNETPAQACAIAKIGARVVLCGIPPHDRFTLSHASARRKGLTIKFARRMKHAYPRAIKLATRGLVELDMLATHRFGLDQTAAAFELAAARRDGVVKAMIEFGNDSG